MMNLTQRFKSLPVKSQKLLGLGVILALVVALPLFIWAIVTQNFNPNKKAASGEPGVCVPQNKVITVTPSTDTNGTCHNIQTAINAVNGGGFTVQIEPGTYNVPSTINVTGKSNLTISGNSQAGSGAATVNFTPGNGWGFLVENSSGSIQWMTLQGGTSNGMLSIHNSNNFSVGYANLNSQSSHTLDIQGSSNVSVYNTEIQSSAGALEVDTSNGIHILNNKIHNSNNAISANNSQNIEVTGNLITTNDESGIRMQNITNLIVYHNTLYNNAKNGHIPAINMDGTIANGAFSNNIIAFNHGAGISFTGTSISATYSRNDMWSSLDGNYFGVSNQTGTNGNISLDPLFNSANGTFCLQIGSPAIYGNIANGEYMGYIGPCGSIPTPSPTSSPSPSPTGTPPPTATGTGKIKIRVKFAGVLDASADGAKITLRVFRPSSYVQNGQTVYVNSDHISSPFTVKYVGNGIYEGLIQFAPNSNVYPGSGYTFYIKGEKHLSRKFCFQTGQTEPCRNTQGQISLYPANSPDIAVYDFTGIPLEPGDLYPQDGVVNVDDFNKIKTLLSKPCSELTDQDKLTTDLDYNGCINVKDAFLMRKTLETKYDEN